MLAACAPKVENHGYIKNLEWQDNIVIGQTTKDEVLSKFGSPSARNNYGNETWYYITSRQEAVAFLKPEIVQQDTVRVEFDQAGVVNKVTSHDKASGKEFDIVKRTTPTEGHSMSVIEQFIGNIGRFNSPGGRTGSVAPGRQGGY